MIEETVKWTRRNKVIDSAFIDNLYNDIIALYKLDQIEAGPVKKDLGTLPSESTYLIIGLGVVWVGILTYTVLTNIKKRKNR